MLHRDIIDMEREGIDLNDFGIYPENTKFSVQAILIKEGKVLAVSRKDNHEDFGLPGGKVESTDGSLKIAMEREILEETGIKVNMETSRIIFSMHRFGYMGFTYFIPDWEGELETDEPHVIKWTRFNELIEGSFGVWNSLVADSLNSMGIYIEK